MSLLIENNSMSLEVDGRVVATARFSEHATDGQVPATGPRLPSSEQLLVQDGPGRRMRLGRDFCGIVNIFA
jgi:hypothetical protein